MKQILLFIAFLCIGLASEAQVLSNLTEAGLKGPVESCETTEYTAIDKFGEINYGDVISQEGIEYDTRGFLTRRGVAGKEYAFLYTYENKYNSSGKIEVIDQYDHKGNLVVRKKFAYTPGKAVETVYGNVLNGSTDRQGEIIWTKGKQVDNASMFKFTYYYDANNRLIKSAQKTITGGETIRTYTYNSKGALVKITSSIPLINSSFSNYKYDERGNWILRVKHDHDGKPLIIQERKIRYRQ